MRKLQLREVIFSNQFTWTGYEPTTVLYLIFIFTASPSGTGEAVYLRANGVLQVGQDERVGGRSDHGLLQQCFCKGSHKVRPCGHSFSGCSPPILPSYFTGDLLG